MIKKTLFTLMVMTLLSVGGPGVVHKATAGDVTLQWDANTEPDLAGYKIYYSHTAGPPYDGTVATMNGETALSPIDVGNVTQATLTLPNGGWFFVVTAYDNEVPSLESDYSNEVYSQESDGPPAPPTGLAKIIQQVWNWIMSLFGSLRVS